MYVLIKLYSHYSSIFQQIKVCLSSKTLSNVHPQTFRGVQTQKPKKHENCYSPGRISKVSLTYHRCKKIVSKVSIPVK